METLPQQFLFLLFYVIHRVIRRFLAKLIWIEREAGEESLKDFCHNCYKSIDETVCQILSMSTVNDVEVQIVWSELNNLWTEDNFMPVCAV